MKIALSLAAAISAGAAVYTSQKVSVVGLTGLAVLLGLWAIMVAVEDMQK